MPGLLLLFFFWFMKQTKHHKRYRRFTDEIFKSQDTDMTPVEAPIATGAFESNYFEESKLPKSPKTILTESCKKAFELTDAAVKSEFDDWWRTKLPSLEEFLWNKFEVPILPVKPLPKDKETLFQIFRQSIIRHISIFHGDYLRAGGTQPRHFPIPECSEIGLGREENEMTSKHLDSLAGSQGDIRYKKIDYYSKGKKGSFMADPDGGVTMVTKYFVIRDKKTEKEGKQEKSADKQKKARRNKERSRQSYLRELSVLESLSHPNIIHGVCTIESRLQIVYPLMRGGDLVPLEEDTVGLKTTSGSYLNPDQTFLPRFSHQLISALHYMHGKGFLHLDLKPENFVVAGPDRHFVRPKGTQDLEAYSLVLIDFGLSEVEARLPDECIKSGTEVTMAPEQVLCNSPIGFGTDWWGAAAGLFRVRVFWEPSIGDKRRDAILHERDPHWGHVILPGQPFFSPDFQSLLNLMLKPCPDERDFDANMQPLLDLNYLK